MTLIAIDGPAGAGKTTLAAQFFDEFSTTKSVAIIHMDDLYAGWENALDARLTSRLAGIVEAFAAHSRFSIPVFNWITMQFDKVQTIEPSDILIIEGVGAGQKVVRDAGAVMYWLDIEPEIGLARVLQRDGYEIESQMHQWQLDQDAHFLRDQTRANADHISTS
jgi:uridine kinase